MKTTLGALAGSVLFVVGSTSSEATVVQYGSSAAWSSAVVGVTAVALPSGTSTYIGTGSSAFAVYSGATFSSVSALGPSAVFVGITTPGIVSAEVQNQVGTTSLTITTSSPVYGIALNYGTVTYANYSPTNPRVIGGVPNVNVLLSNGDEFSAPGASSGLFGFSTPGYLAFTDTSPFTSIRLSTQNVNAASDLTALNVGSIAYAAGLVPEPSALWLMLGGLGVALGRWRQTLRVGQASVGEPRSS